MSFSCSIYGLGLRLNTAIAVLANLPPADRIDVEVRFGEVPSTAELDKGCRQRRYLSPHLDEDGAPELAIYAIPDSSLLRLEYSDGTLIHLDEAGSRVWASGPSSVEDIATMVLGPILGLILRMRGIACLHASAVIVDGMAIALVGPSGAGKSSTAAAFAQLGLPVLSDDKLALRPTADGQIHAHAGYPSIRLWPDSVAGLFGGPDSLPLIGPGSDKRYLALDDQAHRFQQESVPLAALYFLGEREPGAEVRIGAVSAREAFMTLVSDLHANELLTRAQRAAETRFLAMLSEAVPTRRVQPSSDFSSIGELCRRVLEDFRSLTPEAMRA